MVKTKQTKRKSKAEKERREKYRIAKVPSRFGTVAKVATHDPPMLPERNKSTCTCCVLIHVKGVKSTCTECDCTTVIVFNREFQTK